MQADSTRAGVKDLDVLLADESLVLILDDTEHVWEKHRANLIQVGAVREEGEGGLFLMWPVTGVGGWVGEWVGR
jgi:hypothetical protein